MRRLFLLLAALLLSLAGGAADPPPGRGAKPMEGDLAADFACEVDMRLQVPGEEQEGYARRLAAALVAAGVGELAPQHILLVDRSRHVQAAFLYRLAPGGDWLFTGAVPVSTGRPGSYEHFATPLGVFAHSLDNLDFRAEGTANGNGIRGYGEEGMRVFDFGWVRAPRGWGDGGPGVMRLQVHATDPGQLERDLGRARSKGCIRVPASFNRFLDRRGVLDLDYEEAAARGRSFWVLRADRDTTRWPGRYLVVVESERKARPPWARDLRRDARRLPRPAGCLPNPLPGRPRGAASPPPSRGSG